MHTWGFSKLKMRGMKAISARLISSTYKYMKMEKKDKSLVKKEEN